MSDEGSGTLIGQLLRRGVQVSDANVDGLLPDWAGDLSRVHWTPVSVARRAAEFLTEGRGADAHVLDVGSGVGKFCVVGAAVTGAAFTGVERNARLVEVAKALARTLGVRRAQFRNEEMQRHDWSHYDGVYFFNPFSEEFIENGIRDESEPTGWPAFVHHVRSALAKLYLMPVGTRVATFHGLGASLPPGFEQVGRERMYDGMLRFYVRRDPLSVTPPKPPPDFFEQPGMFEEPPASFEPTADAAGVDPLDDVADPLDDTEP